jgi:hypothetical protein
MVDAVKSVWDSTILGDGFRGCHTRRAVCTGDSLKELSKR